uniref:Uncharacterized protein n=1 Tax=Caenorhabditis brenneri TaxID=135651 RepID=B6VBF3_CAEBE|nr:hypothetical protein Cbre_JD07.013 [Caenorhabditis brenneri]
MAEIDQNIIEQFDPETRAKIARQAELRDLFWAERRAYRAGEYATEELYEAGMDRTIALFNQLRVLNEELKRVGYIAPRHRDAPTAAETEANLEILRRLAAVLREHRNHHNAAPPAPPGEPQNEDTGSEGEEENGDDQDD